MAGRTFFKSSASIKRAFVGFAPNNSVSVISSPPSVFVAQSVEPIIFQLSGNWFPSDTLELGFTLDGNPQSLDITPSSPMTAQQFAQYTCDVLEGVSGVTAFCTGTIVSFVYAPGEVVLVSASVS